MDRPVVRSKRMFFKKTFLLYIFFFLIGFFVVLGYRIWKVKQYTSIPFTSQKLTFKQQPPVSAIKGNIGNVHGEVKMQGRDDDNFKLLNQNNIVAGDALGTGKNGSAVITFENFGKVSLDANTQIGFVDVVPTEFLIKQNSGTVSYVASDAAKPISVRLINALVVGSGTFIITYNNGNSQEALQVTSGSAKVAMVDTDNNTKVLEVNEKERIIVDDESRTMKISN